MQSKSCKPGMRAVPGRQSPGRRGRDQSIGTRRCARFILKNCILDATKAAPDQAAAETADVKLERGSRRPAGKSSADLVGKAIRRAAALVELERLLDGRFGRYRADLPPVVGSLDVGAPAFLPIR